MSADELECGTKRTSGTVCTGRLFGQATRRDRGREVFRFFRSDLRLMRKIDSGRSGMGIRRLSWADIIRSHGSGRGHTRAP
jgi:hypothetical protein